MIEIVPTEDHTLDDLDDEPIVLAGPGDDEDDNDDEEEDNEEEVDEDREDRTSPEILDDAVDEAIYGEE